MLEDARARRVARPPVPAHETTRVAGTDAETVRGATIFSARRADGDATRAPAASECVKGATSDSRMSTPRRAAAGATATSSAVGCCSGCAAAVAATSAATARARGAARDIAFLHRCVHNFFWAALRLC